MKPPEKGRKQSCLVPSQTWKMCYITSDPEFAFLKCSSKVHKKIRPYIITPLCMQEQQNVQDEFVFFRVVVCPRNNTRINLMNYFR